MAMRKTVLPHGGNRESLTSLQQWLLLSIWTGEQFDFMDFMLCEIEDVIADAINVG
jgi:predicted cupin superfamily sugar epimerase